MNNRYKRLFEDGDKEGDFWPTFTDMLATILLVVLLFQITNIIRKDIQEQNNMFIINIELLLKKQLKCFV